MLFLSSTSYNLSPLTVEFLRPSVKFKKKQLYFVLHFCSNPEQNNTLAVTKVLHYLNTLIIAPESLQKQH